MKLYYILYNNIVYYNKHIKQLHLKISSDDNMTNEFYSFIRLIFSLVHI